MRLRTAVLFPLITFLVTGTSLAQNDNNVQTINVDEDNGTLRTSSNVLEISTGKPGVIKWVGPEKLQFRVQFVQDDPCDRSTSHLEQNPAVCNVKADPGGLYGFQVVPKKKGKPAPIMFVQVGSCDVCDILKLGTNVGLSCNRHMARAVPAEVFVNNRSSVTWVGLGKEKGDWTVTFEKNSPCDGQSFDSGHPTCKVNASRGEYIYDIRFKNCPNTGRGKIAVR